MLNLQKNAILHCKIVHIKKKMMGKYAFMKLVCTCNMLNIRK